MSILFSSMGAQCVARATSSGKRLALVAAVALGALLVFRSGGGVGAGGDERQSGEVASANVLLDNRAYRDTAFAAEWAECAATSPSCTNWP